MMQLTLCWPYLQLVDGEDCLQSATPLQQYIPGLLQIPLQHVGILLQQSRLHQLVQAPEGAIKLPKPLVVWGQHLSSSTPLERRGLWSAVPPACNVQVFEPLIFCTEILPVVEFCQE